MKLYFVMESRVIMIVTEASLDKVTASFIAIAGILVIG